MRRQPKAHDQRKRKLRLTGADWRIVLRALTYARRAPVPPGWLASEWAMTIAEVETFRETLLHALAQEEADRLAPK